MRNTLTSKLLTASAVGALTFGAAACTSDGTDDPGDEIENDIGDGVEDVGDELEDVGDEIQDETVDE